jgi:pimeloyl-ACP methyl ester carboxylesterase
VTAEEATAEQTVADRIVAAPGRPAPWRFAARWGAQGWLSDLGGPVHWIEFGEPRRPVSGPPIVFVHGLGGSHLNWALVGDALSTGRRAVALDLRGFGMTPGSVYDAGVGANAELLDRFVREVLGEPVVLVGNSMGGMISVLQAASNPDVVAGVVLVDPALPAVRERLDAGVALMFLLYGVPGLGEFYLRRANTTVSAARQVRRVTQLCFADPGRASDAMLAAAEQLLLARRGAPDSESAFLCAARSLMRILRAPRRYRDMMRAIQAPVLLVHGEDDRLVSIAAARRAAEDNPGWRTAYLPGVGHTPQLEVPDRFAHLVNDWLAAQPALAHQPPDHQRHTMPPAPVPGAPKPAAPKPPPAEPPPRARPSLGAPPQTA